MPDTIAIIGYGDMAEQMAPHLIEAGDKVQVYDIKADRNEIAKKAGATVASSGAEAAKGASVIFGLVMSDDIPTAYLGKDGFLSGAQEGAIVVVCSTTTPAMVKKVREGAPKGVHVVDAPIVGGVKYAREKGITFLVGAEADIYNKLKPTLDKLGKNRNVGETGAGVEFKLITNVAVMAAEAGLREALDLADVFGRDYALSMELMSAGPMAAVVKRALDESNPRPLRRSAEDDDTLVSAVDNPEKILPISSAGRARLWEAVKVDPNFEPDFVDLTRKTTSRPPYRD